MNGNDTVVDAETQDAPWQVPLGPESNLFHAMVKVLVLCTLLDCCQQQMELFSWFQPCPAPLS
jgi:hypothetical protein